MKKAYVMAFALLWSASISSSSHADGYPADSVDKFARGFSNISLGWLELIKNSVNEPAQNGALYAPVGLLKGVSHSIGRTLIGAFEVATFPIPLDSVAEPGYVWENFSKETTYGNKP